MEEMRQLHHIACTPKVVCTARQQSARTAAYVHGCSVLPSDRTMGWTSLDEPRPRWHDHVNNFAC